jgi:Beta-propeller repeat
VRNGTDGMLLLAVAGQLPAITAGRAKQLGWIMNSTRVFALALVVACANVPFGLASDSLGRSHELAAEPATAQPATASPRQIYERLPLAFEVNEGQAEREVDFIARGPGYCLFLTATEVALSSRAYAPSAANPGGSETTYPVQPARKSPLRMKLVDANPYPVKSGLQEMAGKVNYLFGKDSAGWRRNIATYARVKYDNVYPLVDLVYYGNQRQLEYDFIVAPGGDPKAIKLGFHGADALLVDAQGELVVQGVDGTVLRLQKLRVYQDTNGGRRDIPAAYAVDGSQVSFQLGEYDSGAPLVIDPVLVYSTKLGGTDSDAGYAIALDAAGNAYVTGDTSSTNFPGTKPRQRTIRGGTDVFVAKFSADGSGLLYATYLGGSGDDVGYGIAVDKAGNAYITGDTRSADFPTAKPWQAKLGGAVDAFVAKLSADGAQLLYSTYFGGGGGERGLGIAVDGAGNAYITGYTNSTDLPVANAFQGAFAGGNADAFVLKLNPDGSAPVYATYLGGGNDRPDIGTSIAADDAGNAYVTGFTNSVDFPTLNPAQPFRGPTDAFVTKFNPGGSALIYSTHLGGTADDEAMGIAVDAAGSAYITGHTESLNYPTTAGALSTSCVAKPVNIPIGDICIGGDAFVSKLAPDGSALVYSTYLNGSGFEVGRSIAVDAAGHAYVTGLTNSSDFPKVNPVQDAFGGGSYDAFVVKLDPGGSALMYSTYLGGGGDDGGYGIAVDAAGDAWIAGYTTSEDFPRRRPLRTSSPQTPRGARDAFVARISDKAAAHH